MGLIMTGYYSAYATDLENLLKILTSAFFGVFGVSLIDSGGDCYKKVRFCEKG